MKISELRQKTVDELSVLLGDLKKEQFNLRFRKAQGDLPSPQRIREARRDIARVKTLQHEAKQKAGQKAKQKDSKG